MKVSIITSVFGNLPVVKECLESWFPLPEEWELVVYDNKVSELDGTKEYVMAKQKEYGFRLVDDGRTLNHPTAIELLMTHTQSDWVLLLDSDAKLTNKKFYDWALSVIKNPTVKVWGKRMVYGNSKIRNYEDGLCLHLPRIVTYALLFDKTFVKSVNADFYNTIIHNGKFVRGDVIADKTGEKVKIGSNVKITGDTGWKVYWEAQARDVYENIPDDIWRCWQHKEGASRQWFAQRSAVK